jgi:N-acylneuraminate cytidylyltransferase
MSNKSVEVLAIIPARAGSKGVLDKNVKLLAGHPLLAWSIKACLLTPSITRTILSTDSKDYAKRGEGYGVEIPFLRPKELSQDQSTDFEFVNHALNLLRTKEGYSPDLVVHIRPTTPLRNPMVIDSAIKLMALNYKDFTSMRSVQEMSESAYKSFEILKSKLVTTFNLENSLDVSNNARQLFPTTYSANGYVDILKPSFIHSSGKIHGNSVYPFNTPNVVEVDTAEDFEFLEFQVKKSPKILTNLFGGI